MADIGTGVCVGAGVGAGTDIGSGAKAQGPEEFGGSPGGVPWALAGLPLRDVCPDARRSPELHGIQ